MEKEVTHAEYPNQPALSGFDLWHHPLHPCLQIHRSYDLIYGDYKYNYPIRSPF